jgi:hypothetical protein
MLAFGNLAWRRETAVMASFKRPFVFAGFVAFAVGASIADTCRAADWAFGPAPSAGPEVPAGPGVPCSISVPFWASGVPTAAVLPWPSVWLGHFSGGRPYCGACGVTLIDWVDEKVCFPSRSVCQAWIAGMRRAFHHPEGYWTCLLLR